MLEMALEKSKEPCTIYIVGADKNHTQTLNVQLLGLDKGVKEHRPGTILIVTPTEFIAASRKGLWPSAVVYVDHYVRERVGAPWQANLDEALARVRQ